MSTIKEIQKALETAALPNVGLTLFESGYINLILNSESDHMGADIKLDKIYKTLDVTIFYRDPYRVIGNAYFALTPGQCDKVSNQLAQKYSPLMRACA